MCTLKLWPSWGGRASPFTIANRNAPNINIQVARVPRLKQNCTCEGREKEVGGRRKKEGGRRKEGGDGGGRWEEGGGEY